MTVKCLLDFEKTAICRSFQQEVPISDLAPYWGVSRRTIIRVLEEAGIDPKIHRRNRKKTKEPCPVLELALAETALERGEVYPPFQIPHYSPLASAYTRPSVPWYVRVFNAVRQFFSPRTA